MRILRWMTEIRRIWKIKTEEIRARVVVTNVGEEIREARLRWLEHAEIKAFTFTPLHHF